MRDDDSGEHRAGGAPDDGTGPDASDDAAEPDAGTAPDEATVTVGAEGFQPPAGDGPPARDDGDQSTTAGLETAVPAADGRFDWRGWLLVAVVVVSFLVLPVLVTLRPVRVVGFQATYLLVPLVPAVLLGATAVWVALGSRQ